MGLNKEKYLDLCGYLGDYTVVESTEFDKDCYTDSDRGVNYYDITDTIGLRAFGAGSVIVKTSWWNEVQIMANNVSLDAVDDVPYLPPTDVEQADIAAAMPDVVKAVPLPPPLPDGDGDLIGVVTSSDNIIIVNPDVSVDINERENDSIVLASRIEVMVSIGYNVEGEFLIISDDIKVALSKLEVMPPRTFSLLVEKYTIPSVARNVPVEDDVVLTQKTVEDDTEDKEFLSEDEVQDRVPGDVALVETESSNEESTEEPLADDPDWDPFIAKEDDDVDWKPIPVDADTTIEKIKQIAEDIKSSAKKGEPIATNAEIKQRLIDNPKGAAIESVGLDVLDVSDGKPEPLLKPLVEVDGVLQGNATESLKIAEKPKNKIDSSSKSKDTTEISNKIIDSDIKAGDGFISAIKDAAPVDTLLAERKRAILAGFDAIDAAVKPLRDFKYEVMVNYQIRELLQGDLTAAKMIKAIKELLKV
jgi:hypothetical protein